MLIDGEAEVLGAPIEKEQRVGENTFINCVSILLT
jgi:hypothetical protein